LPDESVHCVVTSPPYWGLRDYGHQGQIGLEDDPRDFIDALVGVFREVRRVLRPDGTAWVNLGDSYNSIGHKKAGSGYGTTGLAGGVAQMHHPLRRENTFPGLKHKDLVGVPWRVAFALQADGWWLRQDIIWHKPNPMPESVRDRCTKAHEYIFLLSKSERYYYDQDAILEPVAVATVERLSQPGLDQQAGSDRVPGKTNGRMKAVGREGPNANSSLAMSEKSRAGPRKSSAGHAGMPVQSNLDALPNHRGPFDERNKRSVWTVTTQPFKDAHFATFPPALIEPCILAGCPVGGTVLDPFGGAGTTGLVADRLQRDAILIELNPEYADMAERRIRGDAPLFAQVGTD
jgi:DNA modification methylase